MSAEAIAAISAIQTPTLAPSTGVAGSTGVPLAGSFGNLVTDGMNQVNDQLMTGQVQLQQLAAGAPVNLHQVMIGLEESRMSFQLLMQVRNRLLEGYQEVMRMQV
ncbi:MAG: flagellar hook-basal body complex protein FliE [Betaproteobacteria bacterium]